MLAFAVSLQAQNLGNINGFVRKAATQEPLAGVTVRILGTERTAMTDSTGFYRFRGVETRAWNLEASSVGYRTLTKFDIQVTSGNTSEVNFELEEERQELQGVVIRANFPKPVGVVNSVQSPTCSPASKAMMSAPIAVVTLRAVVGVEVTRVFVTI